MAVSAIMVVVVTLYTAINSNLLYILVLYLDSYCPSPLCLATIATVSCS